MKVKKTKLRICHKVGSEAAGDGVETLALELDGILEREIFGEVRQLQYIGGCAW